jgi:hypothetical protein
MSPIWHDPDEPIAAAYVRSSGVRARVRRRQPLLIAGHDIGGPPALLWAALGFDMPIVLTRPARGSSHDCRSGAG